MRYEEISEYANNINSLDEFIVFVDLLKKNYGEQRDEWENDNIETYLNGIVSFLYNIDGYYYNKKENVNLDQPTWRIVARILLAARIFD